MSPEHCRLGPLSTTRTTLSAEAADGQALSTDIRRGKPGRGGLLHNPSARRVHVGRLCGAGRAQQRGLRGCWCIAYHSEYKRGVSDPRTLKEELVRSGRAHAALVFDEDDLAQGWCQYGSPEELGLKHHREYAKDPPPRARWRITCIFVDKRHRGRGVARAGLEGALTQIAAAGGGLVEAISEVTAGREAHGRFLFSASVELFEQYGFTRGRQVGKHAWIVSREIDPA